MTQLSGISGTASAGPWPEPALVLRIPLRPASVAAPVAEAEGGEKRARGTRGPGNVAAVSPLFPLCCASTYCPALLRGKDRAAASGQWGQRAVTMLCLFFSPPLAPLLPLLPLSVPLPLFVPLVQLLLGWRAWRAPRFEPMKIARDPLSRETAAATTHQMQPSSRMSDDMVLRGGGVDW